MTEDIMKQKKPLLQVMDGYEKALGKEHSSTLTSVYCLVFLLHQQQQYGTLRYYIKGYAADMNLHLA